MDPHEPAPQEEALDMLKKRPWNLSRQSDPAWNRSTKLQLLNATDGVIAVPEVNRRAEMGRTSRQRREGDSPLNEKRAMSFSYVIGFVLQCDDVLC